MIYFYPTSDVSITAEHIIAAVNACSMITPAGGMSDASEKQSASEREKRFSVTAFLSVPYILTILAEDMAAMEMLKSMDLVSTGGAPLETRIGDHMVKHGVRLVSRLGSSECGCE